MNKKPDLTLILGGARSGKSRFAEQLARDTNLDRVYLATSQVFDSEMEVRVKKHKTDRGDDWLTIEEPLALIETLQKACAPNRVILVDCLTLWITNLMMAEADIEAAFEDLVVALPNLDGTILFVSNEVGQGIVPDNAMARAFRDHAGFLHQRLAASCDHVYFVTAGLPQKLK
ncbi:bifunctional adenosylcobinamide kinase/adenosylcobinamide-phosphate guanylyltransferase [Sneathiella limimaris]|uniref:bifunctional adenosylcobinamide kinase/adenosylcobinamide-phosphate guanylyltransferase n=1 Tax=Sneathiella limimaris TaxID=1964213 RepID=UPI00146C522B|nr:bifunctional adenosylcobinamide kinase/adenosylcobinamide-phosphate guanylyltransferase [Sneathiella limimaris]